jgi:hypothetical protein
MTNMHRRWIKMVVGMIIAGIIFFAGFGQAVRYLWNWLMPEIFGLHAITYWQAIGLLGLTWLLFGGFGWLGGPRRGHFRGGPMGRRLRHMTPEQRERFFQTVLESLEPRGTPGAAPQESKG